MSYQALARKYRPQSFNDIIGQESVVRTLQNAIEQKRIHHAYLFSGVRGVGKTTAARIFAKAINCVKGPAVEPCNNCSSCQEITEGINLDVREIDAATYTQVDNIRELREVSQFQPARDRQRIFIIDEAHMLSTPAWNALLKLIEEPPPHVSFIMATTEMQKVPATILSRVQRLSFRKITNSEVARRLADICRSEAIETDAASLSLIARRGEGSVRDSLSLLDQVIAFSGKSITIAEVTSVLGLSDTRFFVEMSTNLREGRHGEILDLIEEASAAGRDFKLLYRDLVGFLRSMLLVVGGATQTVTAFEQDDFEAVREAARSFSYSDLLRMLNLLIRDDEVVTRAEHQRLAVEIALLKAASFPRLKSIEEALGDLPATDDGDTAVKTVSAKRVAARRPPAASAIVRSAESPAPASETQALPAVRQVEEDLADREPPPAPQNEVSAAGSSERQSFTERVRAVRRSAASYIEQAKDVRFNDSELIIEFDEANGFFIESLNEKEQLALLNQIAMELAGHPVSVKVRKAETAVVADRRSAQATALSEDPIVKAITKHLGGEIIAPRRTRQKTETS